MKSRNIIKRSEHEQCDFDYIINYKENSDLLKQAALEKIKNRKAMKEKGTRAMADDQVDEEYEVSDDMDYDIDEVDPADKY
jgi:hypothetical protein